MIHSQSLPFKAEEWDTKEISRVTRYIISLCFSKQNISGGHFRCFRNDCGAVKSYTQDRPHSHEKEVAVHAWMISVFLKPDRVDQFVSIYRDGVGPTARAQPGCLYAGLFVDKMTGKAVLLSVWETEADMRAGSANSQLQAQINRTAPMIASQSIIEGFEAFVQPLALHAAASD